MPTLTRWFLRLGLLYLLAGLAVGVGMALRSDWIPLAPAYLHLLLVGWITQLIFGVAHWMFPRANREQPRGRETLGWTILALLNAGLLLRVLVEPFAPEAGGGWLLALSGALQLGAALLFAIHIWPRTAAR
ncbi:MAG: hypothetical protein AAB075_05400 [Gemmatimonadota bacterium]